MTADRVATVMAGISLVIVVLSLIAGALAVSHPTWAWACLIFLMAGLILWTIAFTIANRRR